jgi:hypothetical protein
MEAGEQFAGLSYRLLNSPAWRSLSGPAAKVWLELRTRFNGGNNGQLCLSLEDAAGLLGMSKSTAQRAFRELAEKGFVKLVKQGAWYGRQATQWEVTDRGRNGGQPANDWKHWSPPPKKSEKRNAVPLWHISDDDGTATVPKH